MLLREAPRHCRKGRASLCCVCLRLLSLTFAKPRTVLSGFTENLGCDRIALAFMVTKFSLPHCFRGIASFSTIGRKIFVACADIALLGIAWMVSSYVLDRGRDAPLLLGWSSQDAQRSGRSWRAYLLRILRLFYWMPPIHAHVPLVPLPEESEVHSEGGDERRRRREEQTASLFV